ncbi:MAG: hypothetical protein ACKV2T_34600 [Kofleriaceae bacterium]
MWRRLVVLAFTFASACRPTTPASGPEYVVAPSIAGESVLAVPEPLVQLSLVVRDVQGLYLFEDEQLEAAQIIATWAKTTNLTLEPPARTREILLRAANGLDANTGKACGGPLWSLAALERWREEIHAGGRLEVQVACLPECALLVTASEGTDVAARDAGRTALWTAPFDPSQPWRTELATRLAELVPQEIAPDAIAKTPGAKPRPAQVDAVFARADEDTLPWAIAAKAHACLGDIGAIGLVLETDATGAVARCENYAQRIVANGPVAACACKALGNAAIGGGARRLVTTIALPAASATVATRGGKEVDARLRPAVKRDAGTGLFLPIVTHRSVREWEPPMPWLVAACFADLAANAPAIEASVMVVVDGATAKSSIGDVQVTSGSISPAQRECLGAVIVRATKVPCPAPGTHALSAELFVEQHDP